MEKLSIRTAGLGCALVGLMLYLNTLDCNFCFDDKKAILENPDLRPNVSWSNLLWNDFWGTSMSSKDSHKSYRPLCVATFRLNYLVHEVQPMGYHLVNVLLHSAVCYLYVQLCGLVFREVWPALIAGLLFAVHPIHTEAVAGLVGRADLMAGVLFIGTIISYHKAVENGWHWLLLSMLLCICAVLSKETGITAIGVCLTYEFFIRNKMDVKSTLKLINNMSPQTLKQLDWLRRFIIRVCILAVFTITFVVFRVKMNQGPPKYTIQNNPAMAFKTPYRQLHWAYLCFLDLWLLLNPWHLCAEYAMGAIPVITSLADPRNLLTVITFVSITLVGLYSLWGHTLPQQVVLFGLALMIFPFIPASNLFFPVGFVIAERVLYLPSMGFCLLIGYGAWYCWNKLSHNALSGLVKLGVIFLLLTFAAKTLSRNRNWYSNFTLFCSAIQISPCVQNAKMLNNLGSVYQTDPDLENHTLAETYYRLTTEMDPGYVYAWMNLGNILKEQKKIAEAKEAYREAAALFTTAMEGEDAYAKDALPGESSKIYNILADMLLDNDGDMWEAFQYASESVKWNQEWHVAHNTKGKTLLGLGRNAEAKVELENAVRLKPDFADAHSGLGEVYKNLGDLESAEKYYRKALYLNGNHTMTKFRLAALIVQTPGYAAKYTEAEELLYDVLSLEPENGNATLALGLVYFGLKNLTKAEETFLRTLEIRPDNPKVLYNIGIVQQTMEKYPDAIRHLSRLLELNPENLKAANVLGICYKSMNNQQKARELFEYVLERDPIFGPALINFGIVLIESHEYEQATKVFSLIVELEPNNEGARQQLELLRKHKQKTTANLDKRETTEQSLTDESSPTEQSLTDKSSPTEQSLTDESSPTQSMTNDSSPTEQSLTDDSSPTEQSLTDKSSPTEQSLTDESSPTQSMTNDSSPTEQSLTDDSSPTEQSLTDKSSPTEQSLTDESSPTEQSLTDESSPTEQSLTDESSPTEQSLTDDYSPTEQSLTDDYSPTEQSLTDDSSPTEDIAY